ncbi:dTDP-4-dehydrorhamnose 3,5-epimerase [Streptococcaceae bacterium ESL0729]|nr:dTDP-4-dehydrorhamnose 3,5-epimerase [Streptococcaceae bacterium ESL0729]
MAAKIDNFSSTESKIDGLKIIKTKTAKDERGTVRELYRASAYSEVLPETLRPWQQINLTRTKKGAIRGLHGEAMAKLVTVAYGRAFGVYVDTRPASKTLGQVETVELKPGVQVFVPQGVCNGFQALDDETEYLYFFDNEWKPGMEGVALTPLDKDLNIDWPIPVSMDNFEQVSEKDFNAPTLKDILG